MNVKKETENSILYINIVLIIIAIYSLWVLVKQTYPWLGEVFIDDAYMVCRYARNWLEGGGFSWNIETGPSFGITSPFYLFIITAIIGLTGANDEQALSIGCFGFGLLSILTLCSVGFYILGFRIKRDPYVPLLLVPFLCVNKQFQSYLTRGMETSASIFLLALYTLAIAMVLKKQSYPRLCFTILTGYLSIMTRPDTALYVVLSAPLIFLFSKEFDKKKIGIYLTALLLLGIISLGCFKWLFGSFLPLPFYAKSLGYYEGYTGYALWNTHEYIVQFLRLSLPLVLITIAGLNKENLRITIPIYLTLLITFVYYEGIVQIMGANARYYAPTLAMVSLGAWYCTKTILKLPTQAEGNNQAMTLKVTVKIILICFILMLTAPENRNYQSMGGAKSPSRPPTWNLSETFIEWGRRKLEAKEIAYVPNVTLVKKPGIKAPTLGHRVSIPEIVKILQALPKEIVVAASEYGTIGAKNIDKKVLDFVGLHDQDLKGESNIINAILKQEPDLIWMPHTHYTSLHGKVLENEKFQQDYEYYHGVYDYGIAIRRNSPFYKDIYREVDNNWRHRVKGKPLKDYLTIINQE
jgi:hypothetical protein